MHGWAEAQGAVFEPVGQWMRARYFPKPGEDMPAAVARGEHTGSTSWDGYAAACVCSSGSSRPC